MIINGDIAHENLLNHVKQKLAFNSDKSFKKQKKAVRKKLEELLGLPKIALNACEKNLVIESREQKDGYELIRFCFETEKDFFVPAYLLIPTTGDKKFPVAITLQGHKEGGMYNSIGITKNENDEKYQPRGSFALQAVREGYAALCVELRGMSGELAPNRPDRARGGKCAFTAMTALLLGRTVLGERCWDISRAIDCLEDFSELDTNDIIIAGNSGGGTMSYYSACLDERIKLSVPSCAFCTFEKSILNVHHCSCNYVPNMYEWFDMQDIAVLLAPRKLIIVSGEKDDIFLLEGVKKGYETIKKIYEKAGARNNCELVITPKGHYWCEDLVWNAIRQIKK